MKWQGREKGWRSVNIKKINVKKIIRKLKKKKKTLKLERFQFFFFFSFKLKRLTQNPKIEPKNLWIGLD